MASRFSGNIRASPIALAFLLLQILICSLLAAPVVVQTDSSSHQLRHPASRTNHTPLPLFRSPSGGEMVKTPVNVSIACSKIFRDFICQDNGGNQTSSDECTNCTFGTFLVKHCPKKPDKARRSLRDFATRTKSYAHIDHHECNSYIDLSNNFIDNFRYRLKIDPCSDEEIDAICPPLNDLLKDMDNDDAGREALKKKNNILSMRSQMKWKEFSASYLIFHTTPHFILHPTRAPPIRMVRPVRIVQSTPAPPAPTQLNYDIVYVLGIDRPRMRKRLN